MKNGKVGEGYLIIDGFYKKRNIYYKDPNYYILYKNKRKQIYNI